MKRILAIVLSLAMTMNVMPLGAYAAEGNERFSAAVLPTDRGAGAAVESRELLEEENGTSGGISSVAVTDGVAEVTYSVTENADLVVAVYADAGEEKMIASGTAAVSSGGTEQITLTGTCPEGAVIKAYLLTQEDHAPIGAAYRGTVQADDSSGGAESGSGGDTESGTETEIVASGVCGTSVYWKLDRNGLLTIYGTGDMDSYNYSAPSNLPWDSYRAHIKEIVIESGVTGIADNAFCHCRGLASITIPDSVTSIGYAAFDNCTSLATVIYKATKAKLKGVTIDNEYNANDDLYSATFKCTDGELTLFGSCGNEVWFYLESDGLLTVYGTGDMKAYGAMGVVPWYDYRNKIKQVVIEGDVTSIGEGAFMLCKSLTDVTISESVTSIDYGAFWSCESLTSVTIPTSVTSIGDNSFLSCASLTDITIPASVTSMGSDVFGQCSNLTTVTIDAEISQINEKMFSGCTSLTKVTIPSSVINVAFGAFDNCTSLTTVIFNGTKEQWKSIRIYGMGNDALNYATIRCLNGSVVSCSLDAENSITTGGVSNSETVLRASFAAVPYSGEYSVIVSRSETEPLAPENLIYINQIRAVAGELLSMAFQSDAAPDEMNYVAACTRDAADTPNTPNKPSAPPPIDEGPSAGGDGGGMAVVLVAGVVTVGAVAAAALMVPVKVQGVVSVPDQEKLPEGTKAVLTQNGKVVAQTLVEPDGSFEFKVKRGSYQLTIRYLDPETGEYAEHSQSLHAPQKNLKIAV